MIIIKSHKILLNTTSEIEARFVSWCGASRWAYNYGLERKKSEYEANKKNISSYSLMKEMVVLKKIDEYVWIGDVPKSVPRVAILQLDSAYTNFFRRAKNGNKELGFPKFKSKKHSRMCFHIEADALAVNENKIRIPKIGWIKMYQPIRFKGRLVGTVCISQRADRWYASFNIETKVPDPIENQEKVAIGLDVGVKTLATLSDGKKFDNPKAFYTLEKLLAKSQRQMAQKKKNSNRQQKAKLRVQKIHKRIADIRANSTHHVSSYVASNYNGIAIENLNVSGMVKNHHLAKAILDANMSELHKQLRYKMNWSGGEVRRVDRFFPSSKLCSVCGHLNNKLTLANREWTCICGAKHDRDLNAAINLVNKCFGPMVGGPWTLRVRRINVPNEVSSKSFTKTMDYRLKEKMKDE